jgi:hypothetical protein
MKNIKLLIAVIVGLFVAHATYALEPTGASAFSSSVGGYGPGAAVQKVEGTNGIYYVNTSGGTPGSISPVTAVENVNTVLCVAISPWYTASHTSSVYVVIPTGCTGTVDYYASSSQGATARVTIGSSTYTSNGSLTLGPGTYYLCAYSEMTAPTTNGGQQASIYLTITVD